jgi:uncharacterized protein
MIRRLLKLGTFAAVLGFAIIFAFGQIAIRATPSDVPPLAANEQQIALTAADGVKISASYFPMADNKAPVILLLHGNGSSRAQFQKHVDWLNEAGFAVMAIDFRGHGESEAKSKSFGLYESRDAEAAVKWIRANRPDSKIGVIGVSLGGAAALLGKSGPLRVDAMLVQAVYPDIHRAIYNRVSSRVGDFLALLFTPALTLQSPILYGVTADRISPIKAARNFPGSVFVIGGANDLYTPATETQQLYDTFPGESSMWIAPGLGHDQLSSANDGAYEKRAVEFFTTRLR